jgi:lipid-binding SYLF domain-containing protein
MKPILHIFFVFFLTVWMGRLAAAPIMGNINSGEYEKASKTLEHALRVLDYVLEDPVHGIPQSMINQSEAIVIFPDACMIAAGPYNKPGGIGTAMIHNEDGSWSDPFFVILREGSLDFELGARNSDIVLLFKNKNQILVMDDAAITLGGNVGVGPGPVYNNSQSATDISFEKEVYAYHRSTDHFAGESIEGGILSYYEKLSNSLIETELSYQE